MKFFPVLLLNNAKTKVYVFYVKFSQKIIETIMFHVEQIKASKCFLSEISLYMNITFNVVKYIESEKFHNVIFHKLHLDNLSESLK